MNTPRLVSILSVLAFAIALAWPSPGVAQGHEGPSIGLEKVAEGLVAPTQLTAPDDGSGHRFIVDQIGVIRILTRDGVLMERPFLDLRDRLPDLQEDYDERGLLGLAFHPQYASNGRFFVFYSVPPRSGMPDSTDHANRVSEFRVSSADRHRADTTSERVLLELPWPYTNHNGGTIAFGPADGYLYVALGDGGNRDDEGRGHVTDWYDRNVGGNGQDIEQNLLGSILRLDVNQTSAGRAYAVPADNPFVGRPGLDEIWAYGLRNPSRIAFDASGEHALIASDAGQELWEEIDVIVKGGNYGWNVREGTHCFDAANPQHPPYECPAEAPNGDRLLPPIIEFDHYKGVVAVGGTIYRGTAVPTFQGKYLFADWSSDHDQPRGTLFVATRPTTPGAMWKWEELRVDGTADGGLDEYIRSFGEDAEGEVYVLTSDNQGPKGSTGKVFRVASGSVGSGAHTH